MVTFTPAAGITTTTVIDLAMTEAGTPTRPVVLRTTLPGPRAPPAMIQTEGGPATTLWEKDKFFTEGAAAVVVVAVTGMEPRTHLTVTVMPHRGRFNLLTILPLIAADLAIILPLSMENPPPPNTERGETHKQRGA